MPVYRNPFSELTRRNRMRDEFDPRPRTPKDLNAEPRYGDQPRDSLHEHRLRPYEREASLRSGPDPRNPFMGAIPDMWRGLDNVDEFSQKLDVQDPLYRRPNQMDYPQPRDRGAPRKRIGPQSLAPIKFDETIEFDPPGDEQRDGFRQQVIKAGNVKAILAKSAKGDVELHLGELPLPFENERQAQEFVNNFLRADHIRDFKEEDSGGSRD